MTPTTHAAGTAGLDAPIRSLFEVVARADRPGDVDLPSIGAAMTALAQDHDYLVTRIAELGDRSDFIRLHAPERGPRLMLAHRRTGEMGAVHSHGCWVALAAVTGIETHRRYRLMRTSVPAGNVDPDRIEQVADERLGPGEAVTLLPPDDIHDHGHLEGRGEAAYVLIMTGDDQVRLTRREWDLATGRSRVLVPGVRGRWLASEPF